MKFFPQFCPSNWNAEYNIYEIPFTEEIAIGFLIREDGHYSYLQESEFELLNLDKEELLSNAIKNLEMEFELNDIKVYIFEYGKIAFWYSEIDNFTAVRILTKKYISKLKEIFPDGFNFSIPHRDLITCWKFESESENEKMSLESIEDFNNVEYCLSPKVYRYNEIKIK